MKDLARQWENHTLTSEAKENTIFPLAENGGEMEVGIVENEGKSLYVQYSNINININILLTSPFCLSAHLPRLA